MCGRAKAFCCETPDHTKTAIRKKKYAKIIPFCGETRKNSLSEFRFCDFQCGVRASCASTAFRCVRVCACLCAAHRRCAFVTAAHFHCILLADFPTFYSDYAKTVHDRVTSAPAPATEKAIFRHPYRNRNRKQKR